MNSSIQEPHYRFTSYGFRITSIQILINALQRVEAPFIFPTL